MHLRQPFTPLTELDAEFANYQAFPTPSMTPMPVNLGHQYFSSLHPPVTPLCEHEVFSSSSSSNYTIDPPPISYFDLNQSQSSPTQILPATQIIVTPELATTAPAPEKTSQKRKPESDDDDSVIAIPKKRKTPQKALLTYEGKHARENKMLRETIQTLQKQLNGANEEIKRLREYFDISSTEPQLYVPPIGRRNSRHGTNRARHFSIFSPDTLVSRNGYTFFYQAPTSRPTKNSALTGATVVITDEESSEPNNRNISC